MHQRFESIQGAWTYAVEIHLDEAKCQVSTRSEQYMTGESPPGMGKPTKRKLPSVDLARKYFRYRIATMRWKRIDGDAVPLTPDEDFKDVKDRSREYVYLENPTTGAFWDIDRDVTDVITWGGAIGTKGEETIKQFDWDGDARKHYKSELKTRRNAGYIEPKR